MAQPLGQTTSPEPGIARTFQHSLRRAARSCERPPGLTNGRQTVYAWSMGETLTKATKLRSKADDPLREELERMRRQIDELKRQFDSFVLEGRRFTHDSRTQSPLDQVKEAIAATSNLRTRRGKLSAQRIADTYGMSLSRLASSLGRTRQAVAKTPDADALQPELDAFERVARLSSVMKLQEFRAWLRTPNGALQGRSPMDILGTNERHIVAELVEDMLTGSPN